MYSKLNHLYIHIYPLSLWFPFHLGHHKALSSVPCAPWQVLINYLFYTKQCIYANPNLPVHLTSLFPLWCPDICSLHLCLYLLGKEIHLFPHVCINIQDLFFSSNLLHSVWQSLGSSTQFHSFACSCFSSPLDSSQINGKPWTVVTSGKCRFLLVRWPACVRHQKKKQNKTKASIPQSMFSRERATFTQPRGKTRRQHTRHLLPQVQKPGSPEGLVGLHAREAQLRPLGAMESYTLTQTSRILPRLQSPAPAQPPLTPGRARGSQLSCLAHLPVQEPCTWDSH